MNDTKTESVITIEYEKRRIIGTENTQMRLFEQEENTLKKEIEALKERKVIII